MLKLPIKNMFYLKCWTLTGPNSFKIVYTNFWKCCLQYFTLSSLSETLQWELGIFKIFAYVIQKVKNNLYYLKKKCLVESGFRWKLISSGIGTDRSFNIFILTFLKKWGMNEILKSFLTRSRSTNWVFFTFSFSVQNMFLKLKKKI